MNKLTKGKALILLSIGMFVIAASQIVAQYFEVSDLVKGSIVGMGIGLLLTSVFFGSFKSANN